MVLDCVMPWPTNFSAGAGYDVEVALLQAKAEFDLLRQQDCTLLLISNELGTSLHAAAEAGRKFTGLPGRLSQHIAQQANRAVLLASDPPLAVKRCETWCLSGGRANAAVPPDK